MSDSGVDAGSDTDSFGEMSVGSSVGSQDGDDHHIQVHPPQVEHHHEDNQGDQQEQIQEDELTASNEARLESAASGSSSGACQSNVPTSSSSSSQEHQVHHQQDHLVAAGPSKESLEFSWTNMPDIVLSSPNSRMFHDWRPPDHQQHDLTLKMKSSRKSCFKSPLYHEILAEKKLRTAATTGDLDQVKELLDDGVDPSCSDNKHRTALHFAACTGNVSIARLLLERGADPNLQDVVGNTPLHLAACTNKTEMVTLLLKYGTDVTVLDKSGRSPLHLAEAKLKILQAPSRNTGHSSSSSSSSGVSNLKMQVLQVIEMIQVYLQRSGKLAAVDVLTNFSSRIHQHQTKEEVDHDVHELLSSLSHLSIQNNSS